MDDSQKTRALDDIIDRKYKRYARTIAERLDGKFSPLSLSAEGWSATRWEEFKSQLRQKPVKLPRSERGEYLFERLVANL